MEICYRPVGQEELDLVLFSAFDRRQNVTDCYRRAEDGSWRICFDPFIDDWTTEDFAILVQCLRCTVAKGGVVFGAFAAGRLKGFCSVEAPPLGTRGQYRDLTSLHVSRELRGQGIGSHLFALAADAARRLGGEKLYLSAHSAVETQSFYRGIGCVDAEEIVAAHAEQEPFDCQLEYKL